MGDVPTYWYTAIAHDDACAALQAAYDDINGELTDLNNMAQNSLDQWQTRVSREQYNACKAKWDGAMQNMQQLLPQAKSALQNIQENYHGTDASVSKKFIT